MGKSGGITAAGSHNLRNKAVALAMGLIITALAVAAGERTWLEAYELISYDWRMRKLNNISANEEIVHIDIDDGSLETVGRWPWPRERLVELIETLSQAQVRYIALDILLRQQEKSSEQTEGNGDERLAEALTEAGCVLVPTHFRIPESEEEQPSWVVELKQLLQKNPFKLDGKELSPSLVGQRLGVDEMLVAEGFYRRRQEMVDNQTLELLSAGKINIELDLLKYYGLLESGEGTGEYVVIHRAFRRAKSILEAQRFGQVPQKALAPEVFRPGHIDPPIPEFAQAAGDIAFIANKPDPGGVFRRVPLLAQRDKYVYKQYALALACELLGVEDSRISYDSSGYLVLARAGPEAETIRIPVDRQGRMLINFRKGIEDRWWDSGFVHLPAGKILEIPRLREKIKNNSTKRLAATRAAIRLTGSPEKLQEFDELTKKISELKVQAELDEAKQSWEAIQAEAIDIIRFIHNSLPAKPPSDPEELAEYRNIKLFYQDLVETNYEAENQRLEEIIKESLATLTEKIKGKVCLVGSTASGGAGGSLDYASCPVFEGEVPGIVVHANALNTILQEGFLRQIENRPGLLIIAFCGILATVLSSLLKPLHSIGPVVAGIGAYLAVNFVAFWSGLVLPLVLPLAVILLSWAAVMAYRQLFEAKEKRRMTTALGQFTSPAVARRVLAQPELLRLSGEVREISCYFSDLKGFTSMSERLGAEKTVRLLNRYLDKMTEALFKHGATVNKFAGDGIFAFFGAPEIQLDHARRACLAAVDSQVALAKLCEELAEEGTDQLRMRVGINSGPAVVGNCGSSRKFDYTALGDTVNLASRLEPANKFFGSWNLVSKRTFQEAALPENILARPLGAIIAVGRAEATEVVELLGWDGQDEQKNKAVKNFSVGLEAYQKGQLKEALEIFERGLEIWPDDQPARVYANLSRAALENPTAGEWDPVIRQTEK